MSGPLIRVAAMLILFAAGLRWVLQPERVLARNPSVQNARNVRRFGSVAVAVAMAVLLVTAVEQALA